MKGLEKNDAWSGDIPNDSAIRRRAAHTGCDCLPGTNGSDPEFQDISESKAIAELAGIRCVAAINGNTCGQRMTARELFGKGEDFDASLDPVIRVQFGRLRRALTSYYSSEGRQDPILITIPMRKYAPEFQESGSSSGQLMPGLTAIVPRRSAVQECN